MSRIACIALAAVAAISASAPARASNFTCPATVTVDQSVNGASVAVEHKFRYVSFFDGDPKDLADLAPDEGPDPKKLEQNWMLEHNAEHPIVMVCRYHDTETTFTETVPVAVKSCVLTGMIDANGEVQGSPSLVCK